MIMIMMLSSLSIFIFPDPENSELQYCSLDSMIICVSSCVVFLYKYAYLKTPMGVL